MTAAERVYRLALLAYPAEYRRERGDEILGTLAEMHAERGRLEVSHAVSLVAGGIRERGVRTTGTTRAGVWSEGCRLAALVLLLLASAASLYGIALDTWYSRLGLTWPRGAFTAAPAMSAGPLARSIVAVLLPAAAAAAVCRGRSAIAITCTLLGAALFLAGRIGTGLEDGQSYQLGQEWLANAYRLGDAVFLAAPAALLWAGVRRDGRPAPRRSLVWLAVPAVLAVLRIGFFATSITFWPLGALVLAWFLAARLSPYLAVAAFGVLVPTLAYVIPAAIGDAMLYEYAIAVAAGGAVLALASLASAIALGGDAEVDGPLA